MLFIALTTLLGYLLATLLLWLNIRDDNNAQRFRMLALLIALVALAGHTVLIYHDIHGGGHTGLDLSVLNALATVFWLSTLITIVTSFRHPVENMALVLMPAAAATAAMAFFLPDHSITIHTGKPALDAHILFSLLAYALLTMAALQAAMLAWQHQALHSHHPGGLVRRLPPMESVEHLMFRFITVGFLLLTLALATGFLFIDDIFAQHLIHKTVLSVVAWIIFAALLAGRHFAGWRGKTAVRWTLTGFAFLALAYFGTKIVLEWIIGIR